MMFVILSYDVAEKRVGKMSKIAKKYLVPVQRSLYNGYLTNSQIEKLKRELSEHIDASRDKIVIYKISDTNAMIVDNIGPAKAVEDFII
ncbi:MAG: CRISPR-associated endonuclease Cas2 [Clostridia bacterium]|nr:CRISPR-associated endonuclease Cas2 [Clostridia bacterium]